MSTRKEARANLCNFVSSLSHLSCFITSSRVLSSPLGPKWSALKLLASDVIARLFPRAEQWRLHALCPRCLFCSALLDLACPRGTALLQINSQSNAGGWLTETTMGQAGGSKTLHQRCELRILGVQSRREVDYHWEVPLGEHLKVKMGSGMKPDMSLISISGVNVQDRNAKLR